MVALGDGAGRIQGKRALAPFDALLNLKTEVDPQVGSKV
jgi:hypothetical protein